MSSNKKPDNINVLRIMKKYKCSAHQVMDYMTLEENEKAGNELCKRCDGTGNELFSMYRRCTDCNGTGIAKKEENHA